MSYDVLPAKVKFTLSVPTLRIDPTFIQKNSYYKVVNGKIQYVSDSQNNNYLIEVPYGASAFHYYGMLQALYGGGVGPSVIFLDKDRNILYSFWATDISYMEKDFDIPVGTVQIWAPSLSHTPPIFTFYYDDLDVTEGVINISDVEVTAERDGTSGAVASILFPVQFGVNSTGYNLLKDQYRLNGVRSNMTLTVYEKSYFDETYSTLVSVPLDFFTYQEHETYIEIGGVDSSLTELISAKGSTNYDIPVSELSPENWSYKDIPLNQFAKYEVPAGTDFAISRMSATAISLSEPSGDNIYRVPGSIEHDVRDQSHRVIGGADTSFFQAAATVGVTVRADITTEVFKVNISKKYSDAGARIYTVDPAKLETYLVISHIIPNSSLIDRFRVKGTITGTPIDQGDHYEVSFKAHLEGERRFTLNEGESLSFYVNVSYPFESSAITIPIFNPTVRFALASYFEIVFPSEFAEDNKRVIQVIDPEILFQRFLDLISSKPGEYTGSILWESNGNRYQYRLAAAESIANYENPCFHGNLNDFMKWMYILGYEYQYHHAHKHITYVLRDKLFQSGIALDLSESEVSDLSVSPATEMIYSGVKVGYEKQDYDNDYLNGLEINSTFEYTTGIKGSDNVLDLMSPYRGDAIGIQNLYRSFKETSDKERNDANSDIFAVVLKDGDTYMDTVIESYDQFTGRTIPLFNALLSPPYLARLNVSLIGISTDTLTFTSTNGNKRATINNSSISSDIFITQRLFSPMVYHFSEGSLSFPSGVDELVSSVLITFMWQGEKRRGFIRNISRRVIDEITRDWELYAK